MKKYQVTQGCTFCATCLYECPVEAIRLTETGARIDPTVCVGCGVCVDNCASEAIVAVADGNGRNPHGTAKETGNDRSE